MTITEKMYLFNDVLLDNRVVLSTISSQLTAHSSQLTAHSSQLTKPNFNQNNILFYVNKFLNEREQSRNFFAIRSHCKLSDDCSFFMSWQCFDRFTLGISCRNTLFVCFANSPWLTLGISCRNTSFVCFANSPWLTFDVY